MIADIEIESRASAMRITRSRHQEDVETERRIAVRDLLAENNFQPIGDTSSGPWALSLALKSNVLTLTYKAISGSKDPRTICIKLNAIQSLIRDYFAICESYFTALREDPMGLETIDMARRGLHNEAGELLRDMLADKVDVDLNTARRLFTIVCTMHLAG